MARGKQDAIVEALIMTTRSELARTETERANSRRLRLASAPVEPTKHERLRAAQHASVKGRSVHGRTKLQADAKAGKPDTGRDGGERTTTGVPSAKPSRKSTRGTVPGGEKPSNLTRAVRRSSMTPQARAARGK